MNRLLLQQKSSLKPAWFIIIGYCTKRLCHLWGTYQTKEVTFKFGKLKVGNVVRKCVHILGKRELTALYFRIMNVMNVFLLAFVNGVLSQFSLVQECARFSKKTMLKHTTKRRSSVLEKNTKSGKTSHHSQTANEALRQKKQNKWMQQH